MAPGLYRAGWWWRRAHVCYEVCVRWLRLWAVAGVAGREDARVGLRSKVAAAAGYKWDMRVYAVILSLQPLRVFLCEVRPAMRFSARAINTVRIIAIEGGKKE